MYTKFRLDLAVSYMPIYVHIVMNGLRLRNVLLQELCLPTIKHVYYIGYRFLSVYKFELSALSGL